MAGLSLRKICALLACLILFLPLPARASMRTDGEPMRIALTFDDGPSGAYTAEILDILKENNVKATFFVLGVNVEKAPELLLRIIAEGHEVGNHTYSHPHLHRMDEATLAEELARTDAVIQRVAGYKATLFRPPEGVVNTAVRTAAQSGGYDLILWTIDTRDWALNSPGNIVRTIQREAADGAIILFHDYVVGDSPTPAALRKVIPLLLSRGFTFVKVSEL